MAEKEPRAPPSNVTFQTITIPAGASMSPSLTVNGNNDQVLGITTPPAWDGGAPITFQWSYDGTTFWDIFDRDGSEPGFVWSAGVLLPVQSAYGFYVFPYIKIRSGPRARPVIQSAARTFSVLSQ